MREQYRGSDSILESEGDIMLGFCIVHSSVFGLEADAGAAGAKVSRDVIQIRNSQDVGPRGIRTAVDTFNYKLGAQT